MKKKEMTKESYDEFYNKDSSLSGIENPAYVVCSRRHPMTKESRVVISHPVAVFSRKTDAREFIAQKVSEWSKDLENNFADVSPQFSIEVIENYIK